MWPFMIVDNNVPTNRSNAPKSKKTVTTIATLRRASSATVLSHKVCSGRDWGMKQLDLATAAAKRSVDAGRLAAVRRPAVAKFFRKSYPLVSEALRVRRL